MNQIKNSSEELRTVPPRPPGLPAALPKRRFVRLGRKTSDGTQHCFSRIKNKNMELEMTLNLLSISAVISADALIAEDPSELSNQITAPGILKIFGNEILEGAHYKSVLASTHSSAKELVKEALERYGLGKEEAESYVLCDTIGSIGNHPWRTEGFRILGDHEKPLLLQSLWKPREGLARRFEIQKRSSVEEKTSKEKDTITAGINAQARKLQKSRSRVTSTLIERTVGRSQKLWRSKSEMDLLETKQEAEHDKRREGEESEREETESSDDNTTQYSIHPPHDCPYLLLLQGCSAAQDFVIYLLASPNIVIGQRGGDEEGSKVDIVLFAADILPRHCYFLRQSVAAPTVLCPCRGAVVTKNGKVVRNEEQLCPGDVIGLGQHYLFLFKDPLALILSAASWTLGHTSSATTREKILCSTCISTCTDYQSPSRKQPLSRGPPLLKSPEGHSLTLNYGAEDEDLIVKEIVAMGSSSSISDRPPLTVAFLLCMCVQYSSACLQTSDLRRLLLLIASGVQSAMWEQTKELAAVQPETLRGESSKPEDPTLLCLQQLIPGLRPLVVWMSNSLELLQFIQHQLPLILEWRARKEEEPEREDDETSEETIAVLEEVIMLAFQQCVYYFTKILYPILPGLLDCNPFRESPELRTTSESQVVDVLTECLTLLSDCQVHPEISSQLISYLFYFINASLFNSLMERGSEPGFYQWSRGVRIRANLDLLLDWAHAAGLGELALEDTHTLSSAINLLATPRKNLLQTSWVSLRSDYPALNPAQLNHLLSLYSPASPCRHTWTPSVPDQAAAHQPADILESFDTHHPLVLPDGGYQLQLRRPVTDSALRGELDELKKFISTLSDSHLHVTTAGDHKANLNNMANLQNTSVETFNTSQAQLNLMQASDQNCQSPSTTFGPLPPSPSPPSSSPSPLFTSYLDEFSSCGANILSQKLRNLELQTGETETGDMRRSILDPSCLLTPPNSPLMLDRTDCLAALKVDRLKSDCTNMKTLVELKEEEEDEDEADDHCDGNNDEVFSLELERGERGLGLALVDTRDTSLKAKGIFIRAVVPDSPAALCEKLLPGDRILAVNGISLLGLDYQNGRELIQSSGARLTLLVARSAWMAEVIQNEC
uniref:Si:ch211-176g6.2 n=1 Tax=Amphilophus citrinellus TaxID=61819 RepID=A0A3Q0SN99_AMPCI